MFLYRIKAGCEVSLFFCFFSSTNKFSYSVLSIRNPHFVTLLEQLRQYDVLEQSYHIFERNTFFL